MQRAQGLLDAPRMMIGMRFFYPYGGMFWLHDLIWALVIIAIVVAVLLLVRSSRRHGVYPRPWYGGPGPWQSPGLHELDLRYARGEIGRDEYLQRRADILGHPAQPPSGGPPAAGGGPVQPA